MPHRPRFIVAEFLDKEESKCRISDQQQHHLTNVLRRQLGSEVEVSVKATGCAYLGIHLGAGEILISEKLGGPVTNRICVLLGGPKTKSLEATVEKLAEIGVERLIIFQADHSPLNIFKHREKIGVRLNRLVQASAELSCSGSSMQLQFSSSLQDALKLRLENKKPRFKLIPLAPHERTAEVLELAEFIISPQADTTNRFQKPPKSDDILIIIGPEGGFSLRELELAKSEEFQGVSLGQNVLRVETAAVLIAGIAATLL